MNSNARYVARALSRILRQPFAGWPNQSFPIAKKEWMQQASLRFRMLNFPDQSNMEPPNLMISVIQFFSNLKAAHFSRFQIFPTKILQFQVLRRINEASGELGWSWDGFLGTGELKLCERARFTNLRGVRFFAVTDWIGERSQQWKMWERSDSWQHCTTLLLYNLRLCLFAALGIMSTCQLLMFAAPPSVCLHCFGNGSSSCPWSFWITHKVHIRCSESW